jgi:hypothetical protein
MTKIGLAGVGQMGNNYLTKLEELGIPASNIAIWDIAQERMKKAQEKYPAITVASTLEDMAETAEIFIVTVNTPAHLDVIETITRRAGPRVIPRMGSLHILCEKPLVQTPFEMRKIEELVREFNGLNISTALVITFSLTRDYLAHLMQDEKLELRNFGGRWGKNRGSSKELRPTAGDRVDELIHMAEYGFGLLRDTYIGPVRVMSQVGYLKYANPDSQRTAHTRDSSFPLIPDHSTQVLLDVDIGHGRTTQMSLASSFLEARQVRNVWGTFCKERTDEPVYSFDLNFDVDGADLLYLKRIRTDEHVPTEPFRCDKLRLLTKAFLDYAESGKKDDRLASIVWAGFFVSLAQTIGDFDENHRRGLLQKKHVTM